MDWLYDALRMNTLNPEQIVEDLHKTMHEPYRFTFRQVRASSLIVNLLPPTTMALPSNILFCVCLCVVQSLKSAVSLLTVDSI